MRQRRQRFSSSRNKQNSGSSTSKLVVRCISPAQLHDPKELHTLVVFSLRHLYGDFESHSYGMMVKTYNDEADTAATYRRPASKSDEANFFVIRCCTESVQAIRASLTIVTPPPFLEDTLYQLDVIKISILPRIEER